MPLHLNILEGMALKADITHMSTILIDSGQSFEKSPNKFFSVSFDREFVVIDFFGVFQ
jgi:hypothetical protein